MYKYLFVFILLIPFFNQAQVSRKQAVTYDVVHLRSGKILYGKMIALDGNYVLTFRDEFNRMYYLSKEMYEYIEEDVTFQKRVRNIDTLLRARKVDEFDFHVGMNAMMVGIDAGFIADENYLSSNSYGVFYETPICLNVGVGKYFRQQHYAGIEMNLKAFGGPNSFQHAALQYRFQYDPIKTNVACYIPLTLGYQKLTTTETFQVPDLTMPPFPATIEKSFDVDVRSITLGLGHGWSFMAKDKHYWDLEVQFYKGIKVSHTMITNELNNPNLNYQTNGAQVKFGFHF